MEQLVARWAHNPKVAGSSPAPATQAKATFERRWLFCIYSLFGKNDNFLETKCISADYLDYFAAIPAQ